MKRPIYTIASAPYDRVKIKNLFDLGKGKYIDLLKNPGSLRNSGWDMRTHADPVIRDGRYLEASDGRDKAIKIYDDATCVLHATADSEYLGWGQDANKWEQNPVVNTLALTELTYNYCVFYGKLLSILPDKITQAKVVVQLKNCLGRTNPLRLTPYEVNAVGWQFGLDVREAKQDAYKIPFDVDVAEFTDTPGVIASKILQALYYACGIQPEKYPYTNHDEGGVPYIAVERLK